MYLKDSSGKKSLTATCFVGGFAVAVLKLLLAGNTFGSVAFGAFSGADFALVVGALGAVYAYRQDRASKE
jgi:hypothetical protein